MGDAFHVLLDEVGEEIFGLRWIVYRPVVAAWMDANPERVAWLIHRLRGAL